MNKSLIKHRRTDASCISPSGIEWLVQFSRQAHASTLACNRSCCDWWLDFHDRSSSRGILTDCIILESFQFHTACWNCWYWSNTAGCCGMLARLIHLVIILRSCIHETVFWNVSISLTGIAQCIPGSLELSSPSNNSSGKSSPRERPSVSGSHTELFSDVVPDIDIRAAAIKYCPEPNDNYSLDIVWSLHRNFDGFSHVRPNLLQLKHIGCSLPHLTFRLFTPRQFSKRLINCCKRFPHTWHVL